MLVDGLHFRCLCLNALSPQMTRILCACLLVALKVGDVLGAVIEVRAGGGTEPTYKFSDHSAVQLANLTATDSAIVASGDLKTGTGNGLNDLASRLNATEARLAAAEATILSLSHALYALEPFTPVPGASFNCAARQAGAQPLNPAGSTSRAPAA